MRISTISAAGRLFTENWEGMVPHWYQDIGGVWTGGWGHVERDPAIRMLYLAPFLTSLMDSWMVTDLGKPERTLTAMGLDFSQHEFNALGDIGFNCGTGVFAPTNTITKLLVAGNRAAAADELLAWCHVRINGVVQVNQGLLNRRKAERAMFLTADTIVLDEHLSSYQVCAADSICNPDEIREIVNQGMALWLGEQPDYGARDLSGQ